MEKEKLRVISLFSGYGTDNFALKRLGIPYECVGYSDIDKYANQCFRQNHCKNGSNKLELGDIKEISAEKLQDFDLLTGGFPCQAFSNAGKMQGELDPRGTLFYEIIRIAEVKKPRYMLLENVKGLTNKKFKDTFDKILSELSRIGYSVTWRVLNSKDYGIPQSRARVWFVCFRNYEDCLNFKWPEPKELKIFVKDILEKEIDEKYFLSPLLQERFREYIRRHNPSREKIYDRKGFDSRTRGFRESELSPTLSTKMGTGGNNVPMVIAIRQKDRHGKNEEHIQQFEPREDGCSNTLTSVQKDNLVANCLRARDYKGIPSVKGVMEKQEFNIVGEIGELRRLTPKECFRLMGFLNDEINLEGLSDTQKYKLAGNGQDVNMVSLIFKEMFK